MSMLTSTFWVDDFVGGRCSPKHYSYSPSELKDITILCLEVTLPKEDVFLEETIKIHHIPFPKIQPMTNDNDIVVAKEVVQKSHLLIKQNLNNPQRKRLLIHCGHGNDRTGIVILDYLINIKSINFDNALSLLKSKNPHSLSYKGFEFLANILFNH